MRGGHGRSTDSGVEKKRGGGTGVGIYRDWLVGRRRGTLHERRGKESNGETVTSFAKVLEKFSKRDWGVSVRGEGVARAARGERAAAARTGQGGRTYGKPGPGGVEPIGGARGRRALLWVWTVHAAAFVELLSLSRSFHRAFTIASRFPPRDRPFPKTLDKV